VNAREILEKIQRDAGYTDPEQIMLVARVLTDTTALQARALAGEDVAGELAIVAATAANLDEHLRGVVGNWWLAQVQNMLATALGVAIAGA
jgi:hypothetical protein